MNDSITFINVRSRRAGFPTTASNDSPGLDLTTEEYAQDQQQANVAKTRTFLRPLLARLGADRVLDVGCGVGTMVRTLREDGIDAYGVDVLGIEKFWLQIGNPPDWFVLTDPRRFELPFSDETFGLAYSFGVIEHVGTTDGHADRAKGYHEIRKAWVKELFRTVKVGGHLLLGGPNKNFPVDVAHGLDSRSSRLERWLSSLAGASVHKPWGDNFLWSYSDLRDYLEGLPYELEALRVTGLIELGRVPAPLRPFARMYVQHLPPFMRATGFNPWMLALIRRTA